eukprot:TRINITY_DN3847_c0_g1_i2.p1 TRINITY_DN3847_c0_g1~~TRINITY_DN3847_c0_g1_i2.p1  ORF type:complete len:150 (+),score=7.46 TRINITY_DN3847_c0_g1_i2:94-543(+)
MDKELNFPLIFDVFDNEFTVNFHDRQVANVERVIRFYKHGIPLGVIDNICKLIDILVRKINDGVSDLIMPLTSLTMICGGPFTTKRCHEIETSAEYIVKMLKKLGELMSHDLEPVQIAAIRAVLQYVKNNGEFSQYAKYNLCKPLRTMN